MPQDNDRIANSLMESRDAERASARYPALNMTDARAVAERVREVRQRRGETPRRRPQPHPNRCPEDWIRV